MKSSEEGFLPKKGERDLGPETPRLRGDRDTGKDAMGRKKQRLE